MRFLSILIALAWVATMTSSCHRRATVVRPVMAGRPISIVPPVARRSVPVVPDDLDHRDQLQELLGETNEPVRLRVIAHPLEGDQTTTELISVCRSVLTLASGRTRFDANDPLDSEHAAEEARILGVVPLGTPVNRRRRDPLPPDAEYRALVVAIGRNHLVVPQITPDRGNMEFQVAEAISRLLHGPRLVGLVTADERDANMNKLRRALDRLDVRHVRLDESLSPELSALMIVGPGEKLRRNEVRTIERFLEQGRSVAFLLDGMSVQPQGNRFQVRAVRSGLENLLDDYGISIQRDLIFDNHCGRVSVPARVGRMMLPYPPIPTLAVEEQAMTPDASEVRLPFPSSIRIDRRNRARFTPLLRSSAESWVQTRAFDLSPFQNWTPSGRPGPFLIGVASELDAEPRSRIAVISSARFVEDGYLDAADNALFVRQLVEWLGGHRALTRLIGEEREEPTDDPAPPHEAPSAESLPHAQPDEQ